MSRRVSLPGADELFRTTGGMALQSSTPTRRTNGEARVPAPAGESDPAAGAEDGPQSVPVQGGDGEGDEHVAADAEADAGESRSRGTAPERSARRQATQEGAGGQPARGSKRSRAANRRPSGRERHDEKITVYVSPEELLGLEQARIMLRAEHGLALDRGRIVREAIDLVLADFDANGESSLLVQSLRGS